MSYGNIKSFTAQLAAQYKKAKADWEKAEKRDKSEKNALALRESIDMTSRRLYDAFMLCEEVARPRIADAFQNRNRFRSVISKIHKKEECIT